MLRKNYSTEYETKVYTNNFHLAQEFNASAIELKCFTELIRTIPMKRLYLARFKLFTCYRFRFVWILGIRL
jgi:hypothetical protein